MRILVVNDDGINAPALPHIAKWASKLGETVVVAPKFEQSGKSQAIDFSRNFEVKKVDLVPCVEAYSMDSTPADCVRFGVIGLHKEYDLVISGINKGYNLGEDIAYSGTVGAVLEAGRLGIKAIALSADVPSFQPAMDNIDKVFEYITKNRLFDINGLYNVNFPDKGSDILITRQGSMFYTDEFVYLGNDIYTQTGEPIETDTFDLEIDIDAVRAGYISITPVTYEKTEINAFNTLRGIKEQTP